MSTGVRVVNKVQLGNQPANIVYFVVWLFMFIGQRETKRGGGEVALGAIQKFFIQ